MTGFVTNRLERIWPGPNLKYYPGKRLEGLRKTMEKLSQDSWCLARDSNCAPRECQDAFPLEISSRVNFYIKIGQQYRTLYCVPVGILSETRVKKKFRTNVVKKNTTYFMPNTLFLSVLRFSCAMSVFPKLLDKEGHTVLLFYFIRHHSRILHFVWNISDGTSSSVTQIIKSSVLLSVCAGD